MSILTERLEDYLAVPRSLGFDLSFSARVLRRFTAFADREGIDQSARSGKGQKRPKLPWLPTEKVPPSKGSSLCDKRPLVRQNERGMFCGSSGRCDNPDFGAPSTDAPDGRVSWPRQRVLNINFALCCPIESKPESS
jgi:hypothetical protein